MPQGISKNINQMEFSDQAHKYLIHLKRDANWVTSDRDKIIDYLKHQNISPFEEIITFQLNFSGLKLTLSGKPGSSFEAQLFSQKDLQSNQSIHIMEIDGRTYFEIGGHVTAPFWFVINDLGEIATYDNNTGKVNIIFSSFNKCIETYAMEDFLIINKR